MFVASPSASPPALGASPMQPPSAASAPTAYAAQPAFQLPPAYAAAAGYSAPAGYQPVLASTPMAAPPYLASQTADRASRPIDPYRDGLRLVLFVFGILLIGAFCTPLSSAPAFHWDAVLASSPVEAKLPALFIAVVGLMALVLASMPLPSVVRGILAVVFAGAALILPRVLAGLGDWRSAVGLVGPLVLVGGLLLRHEYREHVLPRILVTIGVAAVLSLVLVPVGGELPLMKLLNAVIDLPGKAKVGPILELVALVLTVLSLLVWLPAPATGGAKAIAWLLIFWPLVGHLATVILSEAVLDALRAAPFDVVMKWVPVVAYVAIFGYGLATTLGKSLEPS